MSAGIYSIVFRGTADWGMGLLLLQDGKITGADAAGALYDGSYADTGDSIAADLTLVVPPGVQLVQGTPPKSVQYSVPFKAILPKKSVEDSKPILINLPPGPVNVILKMLRPL